MTLTPGPHLNEGLEKNKPSFPTLPTVLSGLWDCGSSSVEAFRFTLFIFLSRLIPVISQIICQPSRLRLVFILRVNWCSIRLAHTARLVPGLKTKTPEKD